ncbi:MAG: ATP-binding protein [Myxococcota bacterium]
MTSIQARFALAFIVAGFLVSIGFDWIMDWRFQTAYDAETEHKLQTVLGGPMRGVAEAMRERSPREQDQLVEELRPAFSEPISLMSLDELSEESFVDHPIDPHQLTTFFDGDFFFVTQPVGRDRFVVVGPTITPSVVPYDAVSLGIFSAWVLGITSLATWYAVAPVIARVRRVRDAARRLASGDLDARVHQGQGRTLAELEHDFNSMATRMNQLVSGQEELLRAVCHEVRTPIARIRFSVENLLESTEQHTRARSNDIIDRSLTELEEMASQLTHALRARTAPQPSNLQTVDVGAIAADQVSQLEPTCDVTIDAQPGLGLVSETSDFSRTFSNLARNAFRHARSRVAISIRCEEGSVVLRVEDDGSGIRLEDREVIFEPFRRLDESRSTDTGGIGLGLTVVRSAVSRQEGTVSVDDSSLGGARFVVRWPESMTGRVPV